MLSPALRTVILRKRRYQGPGDITINASSANWWVFLSSARAFNAFYAVAQGPLMDLADQSLANPITIRCLPSGFADVGALRSWVATNSVSTIQVTKLYDQSGSGRHFDTIGGANYPTLTVNGLNGLPVMNFTASPSTGLRTSAVNLSFSQPATMGTVAMRTTVGSSSTPDAAIGTSNAGSILGFQSGVTNKACINAGTANFVAAANDGVWHALGGLFSGVSSALNLNSSAGVVPSVIAGIGAGPRIVALKVLAATAAHGALKRFGLGVLHMLRYRNCFNRLNYGIAALRRHGFQLCGGLLFDGRGILLHGLSAMSFDDLLALNRENDFSRSGHPDRHTASGWHIFLSRRFCWHGAWIHCAGCLSEGCAAHHREKESQRKCRCHSNCSHGKVSLEMLR
jgi:hypothetical protein